MLGVDSPESDLAETARGKHCVCDSSTGDSPTLEKPHSPDEMDPIFESEMNHTNRTGTRREVSLVLLAAASARLLRGYPVLPPSLGFMFRAKFSSAKTERIIYFRPIFQLFILEPKNCTVRMKFASRFSCWSDARQA